MRGGKFGLMREGEGGEVRRNNGWESEKKD